MRKILEALHNGNAFLFAMHHLILLTVCSFLSDYITDLLQETMDLCKKKAHKQAPVPHQSLFAQTMSIL